jgi:ribosomal protein S18 acetylase RimI-like enzyme
MVIRRADTADASAIADIHVRAWQAAYRGLVPDEQLERLDVDRCAAAWESQLVDSSWPAYVLNGDGVVRGFCSTAKCAESDLDSEQAAEMPALYLDPGLWGRGHGRMLCEAVMAELRLRGFSQVVVWVLDGNERATGFYRALGFVADGATKKHPRVDGELLRYRRCLDPGT